MKKNYEWNFHKHINATEMEREVTLPEPLSEQQAGSEKKKARELAVHKHTLHS